jgi:hypothetical protein
MYDFEKLGAFYLGKRVDEATGATTDELVLYDSKDLTTHAVIIGMTGSGKTGLGIDLIEEAALDHVPVIAIDPKGDLGNLLLTFPHLAPGDFRPWINEREAATRCLTPEAFAEEQAATWKKGLAAWGQDGARIAKLKESAEAAIYTPGSAAGRPISLLRSFAAPSAALRDDSDLYRDRIASTATGLLSLVDIEADPLTSREHILLSQILHHAWAAGRDLDLAALIAAIQAPPVERVGVMSLDTFYPPKERFELAMRLNNLLAAPGFEAWMQGEALDAAKLFYTQDGKPRISVISIAHLADAERMFFVAMLLNEVIGWMRAQAGTSSLRAILYMDELAGYMPPVANPPAKPLFLTLLKQARAYGLGLVLATQNPVDLDYKGLSNAGTWFIGRLQTERDKARVMEGLEGASQGGAFDRQAMERTLAGLGKRRFLLHNVHEDEPVVFETRWAMSYLAGPLTREQIRTLTATAPAAAPEPPSSSAAPAAQPAPASPARPAGPAATGTAQGAAPLLPPSIRQFRLDAEPGAMHRPRIVASVHMHFSSATHDVHEERRFVFTADFDANGRAPDWEHGAKSELDPGALRDGPPQGAACAACPPAAGDEDAWPAWQKQLTQWLRHNEYVRLFKSRRFRLTSRPGESEGEFRVRLQQRASEERDAAIDKIRKRYASKVTTLENRLLRAEQAIARERDQASSRTMSTAVSFGTAILGAVLGRKRLSASTVGRIGTAIRSAGGSRKQAADVARAEEQAARVRAELEALNGSLQAEIDALDTALNAQSEPLEEIIIRAKASDVQIPLFGLLWDPR